MLCDSFTLVRYGCLPVSVQYRFGLDPAKGRPQSDIQRFASYTLERDPVVPAQSFVLALHAQRSGQQYGAVVDFEHALVGWEAAITGRAKAGLDAKAVDRVAVGGYVAPGVVGSPAKDEAVRRLRAAREAVDG